MAKKDVLKNTSDYLSKAGSYLANLTGQIPDGLSELAKKYYNYYNQREAKRDGFRQNVSNGLEGIYKSLPSNVQGGIDAAGEYTKNLLGAYDTEDYLKGVDNTIRGMILGPVAQGADQAMGRVFDSYKKQYGSGEGVTNPTSFVPEAREVKGAVSGGVPRKQLAAPALTYSSELEGGGSENTGSENALSYTEQLKGMQDSAVEKYNADIDYAKANKDRAYKEAEDRYKIAAREAEANFRANQPTYGLTAEQLHKNGLTGSGYSDYLGGKAIEARSDEVNSARSQLSYSQMLADQDYNDSVAKAETDRFNNKTAISQLQAAYAKEIEAEYNAKVEDVVQGIMDGLYDSAIAERILKNYSINGSIPDSTIQMLKNAESNYWTANKNSVTSTFMDWIQSCLQSGTPVTEASARQYLIDNAKGITEEEIQAYMDGYFKDGKLNKDANFGSSSSGTGNTGASGNTGSTGNTGTTGNTGNTGNAGSGGNTGNTGVGAKPPTEPEGFEDTIESFRDVMLNHDIGNGEEYKKLLDDYASFATSGQSDAEAVKKIENMANGLVVSSGVLEDNKGLQLKYQDGDNFTVKIGGQSYRVESQGAADDTVKNAAKDVADGVVFGYGSELYLKAGDRVIKIGARPVFGNGDYDPLWKAVYGEALDNIKSGTQVTNTGAVTERKNIFEKMGDAITINNPFKKPETNTNILSYMANLLGLTKGEENKIPEDIMQDIRDDSLSDLKQEPSAEGVGGNSGSIDTSGFRITGASFKGEKGGFLSGLKNSDPTGDFEKGDNITVSYNSKDYYLDIGGTASEDSNAFAACKNQNIPAGSVFVDENGTMYMSRGAEKAPYYLIGRQGVSFHTGDYLKLKNTLQGSMNAADSKVTRGAAGFESDGLINKGLEKGDNFTVEVANKSYRVESGGEVTDVNVKNAAEEAGIHNGEVFMLGDDIYLKNGDKIYSVDSRFFAPNQDDKLKDAIKGNTEAVADENAEIYQQSTYLVGDGGKDSLDKIEVEDLDGNKYKLQIRSVLGSDSAAYKAGINQKVSDGEAFIHGKDIYVLDGDKAYKVAAVSGSKNGDYGKLHSTLTNENIDAAGAVKNSYVQVDDEVRNGAFLHTNEWKKGKLIVVPIKMNGKTTSYGTICKTITTAGAYKEAKSAGLSQGELYIWNDRLYVYLGDSAALLGHGDSVEDKATYDALMNAVEERIATSYSENLTGGGGR